MDDPSAETRRAIRALRDSAEDRLMGDTRPRMIPVEGGEPMLWTEFNEHEQEGVTGGRIQRQRAE